MIMTGLVIDRRGGTSCTKCCNGGGYLCLAIYLTTSDLSRPLVRHSIAYK